MTAPTTSPGKELEVYSVGDASSVNATDASVAINRWLRDAQDVGQSVVRLLPGRFVIQNPVKLLDGVILEGSGPEVTEIVIGTGWATRTDGSPLPDAITIDEVLPFSETGPTLGPFPFEQRTWLAAAVLPRQDRVLVNTVTPRPLLPGDDPIVDGWHLLFSGEPFNEETNYTQRMRGELVRVFARNDATGQVVIEGMTRDKYSTAETSTIRRGEEDPGPFLNAAMLPIRFATGCGVRNLAVTREPQAVPRRNAGAAICLKWVRRGVVENCRLHDLDCAGVILHSCLHTRVQDCVIEDLLDNEPGKQFGYGVLVGLASESIVITGNRIRRVRHGVDSGQLVPGKVLNPDEQAEAKRHHAGVARGVIISSNVISGCTNGGISTHAQGAGVTITGNVISNTVGFGVEMRAPSSFVHGNTIEWCGGGIRVGNPQSPGNPVLNGAGTQVVGNVIRHVGTFSNKWPPAGEVIGSGAGGPGTGIELRGTDHVNVVGNTISDCWGPGIELRNLTSRCVIANNVLTDVCQRVNKAGIELIGPETGLPPGAHGATSNLLRGNVIFTTSPDGEHGIGDAGAPTGQGNATYGIYVRNNTTFNVGNIVVDNLAANMTAPSPDAVRFDAPPPLPRLDADNPSFDN